MFTILGEGVKLYGLGFRDYLVGSGNLFHLAELRELNNVIRNETGIEDQTAPGIMQPMVDLAKEAYPPGTPFNISADERAVGSLLIYFSICKTSQLPNTHIVRVQF